MRSFDAVAAEVRADQPYPAPTVAQAEAVAKAAALLEQNLILAAALVLERGGVRSLAHAAWIAAQLQTPEVPA